MLRHLAQPTNPIQQFRFTHLRSPKFRALVRAAYVENFEEWRSRKTQLKLKRIDVSTAEEAVDFRRVEMMVKKEVTAAPFDEPVAIKKARGIQFAINERSAYEHIEDFDAFSHGMAQFTEEPYECEGITFEIAYAAHMNHRAIGKFATDSELFRRRYAWSVIDERDGKNWDANVQTAHREALCEVYEEVLGKGFADYVRTGIKVSGKFRERKGNVWVKYEVDGTVKSGHGDTSCGNGALNREITIQAVLLLPKRLRPVRVRGIVMGDDYIAWMYFDAPKQPQELLDALNGAEAQLGIHPVRGLFDKVEQASFISLGFYRAHDQLTVIALPKVGRLLSRLFWTVTDLRGRDPRRLASGIAQSFYPLFSTMPLMRSFLKHHMQLPPIDARDLNHYYNWADVCPERLEQPINWDENALVKYGFLYSDIPTFPEQPQGAGFADHPLVRKMYEIDQADPNDRPGHL